MSYSDLTRYQRGARDPDAVEAHRRYERDRRHAIDTAENPRDRSPAYLVQYLTPDGIVATCHRDLAAVFARLLTQSPRGRAGMRNRVRRHAHG